MGGKPLVSVIIPTLNSAHFVTLAVQSVLAQTHSPVEIIVIDDGSSDDTREQLEPFGNRIRYIYQANAGVSKARNRGVEESRGDLIAFLDADDQWLPEKLEKQVRYLDLNPATALVHTDSHQLREPGGERVYCYRHRERFAGSCYTEFFWANRITTSTVVVTRTCLERLGAFDEHIRGPSTEDHDLWFRIARAYPLGYVNEPLALYRLHATNGSLNRRRMAEDEYYVLAKAMEADPGLYNAIGPAQARRRMFALACCAGHANLDTDDFPGARRFFTEALRYAPVSVRVWTKWCATFLPPGVRQRLRRLKQCLGPRQAVTNSYA